MPIRRVNKKISLSSKNKKGDAGRAAIFCMPKTPHHQLRLQVMRVETKVLLICFDYLTHRKQ